MLAAVTACRHPREKSAELWLGGDVSLGDAEKNQLLGMAGMVPGAAGIVNLEGPVSARPPADGKLRLWNAPSAVAELAAFQVKVAGIANNHAGDAGAHGQEQTAAYLRQSGILPAGGPAGPALFQMNGISVAVTAHDLTNGVPSQLEADLVAARRQADILVATFHVTGPPSYLPRPELKRAVEIAYHAGAQVIAAHGTHAIGPVERREKAVIAWGLGNIAFACDCTQEEDAIILRVVIQSSGVGKAEVLPLKAGINNRVAEPAQDAKGIFDLLEAIGSSKLKREGNKASF